MTNLNSKSKSSFHIFSCEGLSLFFDTLFFSSGTLVSVQPLQNGGCYRRVYGKNSDTLTITGKFPLSESANFSTMVSNLCGKLLTFSLDNVTYENAVLLNGEFKLEKADDLCNYTLKMGWADE